VEAETLGFLLFGTGCVVLCWKWGIIPAISAVTLRCAYLGVELVFLTVEVCDWTVTQFLCLRLFCNIKQQ